MDAAHHDLVLAITSHLPHLIAFNIVTHGGRSRGGDEIGGDQIFGRRVSRLHAHRGIRSGDVAGRVPQQQGRGARNARAVFGGSVGAAARHPLERRGYAHDAVHPRARDPARHHRRGPGHGVGGLRPAEGAARGGRQVCKGRSSDSSWRGATTGAMESFWVFGYGSLMWRPGFDYEERRSAVLNGSASRPVRLFPCASRHAGETGPGHGARSGRLLPRRGLPDALRRRGRKRSITCVSASR